MQDAQELNDPDKVSATWVKHLYGLVDEFNDTETDMIGMKPSDAIKLDQVPQSIKRIILKKRNCMRMGCIITYCNLAKNMMINNTKQLIEYGQRKLTD